MNDMKATGMARRVDDLGRIVIPKEIRKTLRIQEGDPMEIYISDNRVVFQKYDYTLSIAEAIVDLKFVINNENDIENKSELLKKVKELEDIVNINNENM